MKKLTKFLFYSAIIASAVFIVSCSDDVVDSNTTKDSGIPFRVNASVNNSGTRASDITTLKNFQIWGFTGDATNELAGVNCTLASGGGYVPATTVNWPDANTSYTFYAVSNNTKTLSSNISNNDITGSSHSFDYTMPYTVVDGKNVVTIASQEDLLAAAASGKSTTGVTLPFDHILSAVKLKLSVNPSTTNYGSNLKDGTDYRFLLKIRKIKIRNVKISGNYNFITGWNTNDGVLGDYVIDFSTNPIFIELNASDGKYESMVDIDNIYFIPQTISPWNIVPNAGNDVSVPGTDNNYAYMEFEAISMVYVPAGVKDLLENLISASTEGWTKNSNNDYLYNGEVVVTSSGVVVDFNNVTINDSENFGEQPAIEEYDFDDNYSGTYRDIVDDNLYGIFYTPFKVTLGTNGNIILKINLDKGVRKDASAVFGDGAEAGA